MEGDGLAGAGKPDSNFVGPANKPGCKYNNKTRYHPNVLQKLILILNNQPGWQGIKDQSVRKTRKYFTV